MTNELLAAQRRYAAALERAEVTRGDFRTLARAAAEERGLSTVARELGMTRQRLWQILNA